MEGFNIARFEREIIRSFEDRELTPIALFLLKELNSAIGKKTILKFDRQTNKVIRENCLQKMIERWEGHYEAKKPIFQYFYDICRLGYRSEVLKIKQLEKVGMR